MASAGFQGSPTNESWHAAAASAVAAHEQVRWRKLGGSALSQTWLLTIGQAQRYFVKANAGDQLPMSEAEADGLRAMQGTSTIRVPHVLTSGAAGDTSFLVLEFLELEGRTCAAALGAALARLHRVTGASFGWHRNNTIGLTHQANTPTADWTVFWAERRLQPQLELAAQNGFRGRVQSQGAALLERLPDLLAGHSPLPSLLHGDLWGGNWGCVVHETHGSEPVVFDPATYYGDRETDLAMTELFGGFGAEFYAAYQRAWPLDSGYQRRRTLYQLYHVLNHLNLFGTAYLGRAETLLDELTRVR